MIDTQRGGMERLRRVAPTSHTRDRSQGSVLSTRNGTHGKKRLVARINKLEGINWLWRLRISSKMHEFVPEYTGSLWQLTLFSENPFLGATANVFDYPTS